MFLVHRHIRSHVMIPQTTWSNKTCRIKCLQVPKSLTLQGQYNLWDAKNVNCTILQTHYRVLDSPVITSWSWQKIHWLECVKDCSFYQYNLLPPVYRKVILTWDGNLLPDPGISHLWFREIKNCHIICVPRLYHNSIHRKFPLIKKNKS